MSRTCRFLASFLSASIAVSLAAVEVSEKDLREILSQNQALQQQVQAQQKQIDALRSRLDTMQGEVSEAGKNSAPAARSSGEIRLSAEVGLAFFSSGRTGAFPNSEFRVDDARIFLEAPVWKTVYFFTGLEVTTREANDEYFHVGELYADVEQLLTAGRRQTLNLRVGRFNLPFGEEYQTRNVIDNPLITHSLADIWGIDEGAQIYGLLGPLSYNLAVQNGGHKTLHDYHKDKSLTARIGIDPLPSLHLSASAHRTGRLSAAGDSLSEIWFAGGFFRALGAAANTTTFAAELYQADAAWSWRENHLKLSGGVVRFDDNSTASDNSRRLNYYSVELLQHLANKFYGAARYSEVRAGKGYPLVGLGDFGRYLFASPPTQTLSRLSLGLSYRFAAPLIWKTEYSWENGRLINGVKRDQEDLLSSELALKF